MATFRIYVDKDSGYWKKLVEHESKTKISFFGHNYNLIRTYIPMVEANDMKLFVVIMEDLCQIWQARADI